MRATIRCFTIALIFLALAQLASAQIVHLVVDDTIQPISAEYISRGIDAANARHADAVLIDLRTPGGLETSTREIVQNILASPIPVIVYVSPSGARAASAGFFILESADVAAMAPGTNTGAAHPVMMGGGKMDDVMAEKVTNDASAFIRSYVSKRGHNAQIAESAVRESKSFTDQEALSGSAHRRRRDQRSGPAEELDGREITRFDGSKVVLQTADQALAVFDMTLKAANSWLPHGPQHVLRDARRWTARTVCGIQSSGRNRSWRRRLLLRCPRHLRPEHPAGPLHRAWL